MKCTTKHKNLMTTSNSFVFRSSENKDEQELPVKQKTNVSKNWTSADIVSKVVGLEKQAWKHRSDSEPNDSEMPAGVSVKQPNTELINVKFRLLAAINKERLLSNATSGKSTYTTVAGLIKSGYWNKWQLFTCTKNLSSIGNAKCARKTWPATQRQSVDSNYTCTRCRRHADCSQLRMTWIPVQFHRNYRASQRLRKSRACPIMCVYRKQRDKQEGLYRTCPQSATDIQGFLNNLASQCGWSAHSDYPEARSR